MPPKPTVDDLVRARTRKKLARAADDAPEYEPPEDRSVPAPSANGMASNPPQEDEPPADEIGILLSQVEPESVTWLWPGRIPMGKLTILDGDPGLGKSVFTMDVAGRVSAGL